MTNHHRRLRRAGLGLASVLVAAGVLGPTGAAAQTIIEDWAKVQAPAAPALQPVTVSLTDTALLILDFNGAQDPSKGPCNATLRPRCLASIPKVKTLLDAARAKGVFVVYSLSGTAVPADIATDLAPKPGDPVVRSGPDKFVGTDLDKILAGKGIKTVIVTGTTAEGAVLDTGTDAALKGMSVIVPVDGMSAADLYPEQYVAWHMTHAPGVAAKTILTRIDMITF